MPLKPFPPFFSIRETAANTAKAFRDLLQKNKGEVRLLLEELKKNSTLSWLVVDREAEPQRIIPQLSTKAYDRLLEKGFNFNDLSPRQRIVRGNSNLEDSNLSSFIC